MTGKGLEYTDSITGHIRGHLVVWDEVTDRYLYEDSREPAEGWGGDARPCASCGEMPTPEGYDACIGFVPGKTSVCCGHGIEAGYSR